jgi:hypothetical protein
MPRGLLPPLDAPRHSSLSTSRKHLLLPLAVVFAATVVLAFLYWLQSRTAFFYDSRFDQKKLPPLAFTFPKSAPAHLGDAFARWALSDSVRQDLWAIVEGAPISAPSGRRFLALTVVNEGMIGFASNMICSFQLAGIPSNYHFFIALDKVARDAMSNLNAQVLLFDTGNFTADAVNNHRLVDFYDIVKVKPTFIHQLLLWNVDAIPVDADMVFFEDAFALFRDSTDFETQCDSKEYFRIPYENDSVAWQVNLGFYKLHATSVVMKLMPIWLEKMYGIPKIQDQSALRRILRPCPTRWLNNETAIVDVRELFPGDPEAENITLRFLDPMLVTNAGGLWQEGKRDWREEAKRRRIKRPIAIHFFHIGYIKSKLDLIKRNDLWFVQDDGKCLKKPPSAAVEWPLWNAKSSAKNADGKAPVQ